MKMHTAERNVLMKMYTAEQDVLMKMHTAEHEEMHQMFIEIRLYIGTNKVNLNRDRKFLRLRFLKFLLSSHFFLTRNIFFYTLKYALFTCKNVDVFVSSLIESLLTKH